MAENIMQVGLNAVQPNTLQDSKGGADGEVCWVSLGSTQPTCLLHALLSASVLDSALPVPSMEPYLLHPCSRTQPTGGEKMDLELLGFVVCRLG